MVRLTTRSVQRLTVGVVQACNDVADLAKLSLREKLRLLEAIWEDLRARMDAMEGPRKHRQILDERRERIDSGEAKLLDWDQVKHSLP